MESSLSLVANSNNQITTFSYDASGNTLNDTHNSYTWDAESEIKTAGGVTYTYDGDGDRVQKSSGKIYWYGAGSEILDESDSSGNITDEYVYFGGRRVAHRVVSGNSIYYYGEDFLGTSRQIFTSASALCYDADFYPFGGERAYTTTCTPTYKFEGKERDSETSNDDFGARYYSSSFARWTSPDWSAIPEPVPYANLTNPQTLNLYAMVSDNAETFADLDAIVPHVLRRRRKQPSPWLNRYSLLQKRIPRCFRKLPTLFRRTLHRSTMQLRTHQIPEENGSLRDLRLAFPLSRETRRPRQSLIMLREKRRRQSQRRRLHPGERVLFTKFPALRHAAANHTLDVTINRTQRKPEDRKTDETELRQKWLIRMTRTTYRKGRSKNKNILTTTGEC
jgi:RHS repeat-associated protein